MKKKFKIVTSEVVHYETVVEANSLEEAINKVEQGEEKVDCEFSDVVADRQFQVLNDLCEEI